MLDCYYKSKALIYQLSENLHDYNLHFENVAFILSIQQTQRF